MIYCLLIKSVEMQRDFVVVRKALLQTILEVRKGLL